mgnify:CR=1 FL=1
MATIIPSASRAARSAFGGAIGQSLALHYSQSGSWIALQTELSARAVSRTINSCGQMNGALSGRASCRSIAVADGKLGASDYWWDDIGNTSGQMILDFLANVALLPQPLDFVIWNQGQADTNSLNGSNMSAAAAWTLHYDAVRNTIAAIRTALSLPNLPFFLDMPPSSGISRGRAYERLRQCDLAVVRNTANVFRGGEQYDLSRRDSTHLNHSGAREQGRRVGHLVAADVFGATSFYRGPSVASVTKISATQTDVAITVEAGDTLVKPTDVPFHWRVESDTSYGTALAISAISWSGNTARLTHANCAGNPVFYPNYDDCLTYSATRWVGGTVSGMPLRSRDLGWTTAL